MHKGPGRSPAQEIDDDAKATLEANKPRLWSMGTWPGSDFGYDYSVTAFSPAGNGASRTFAVQLKGTTQATAKSADGLTLKHSFDRTTLNLWHRSNFAVVVVIADLIASRDPKLAAVHYHFASPELDSLLDELPDDQKTVTLHVPVGQLVHRELDILQIIEPYLEEADEARQLLRERRRASGTTASDRLAIGAAPAASPPSAAIVGDEVEALILASHFAEDLSAALAALRNGDFDQVLEFCPELTPEFREKLPRDAGLSAHLRSMALEAIGDYEGARNLADLALELIPNLDATVGAVAQKRLDRLPFGEEGRDDRARLLKFVDGYEGLAVSGVRSKILALNGEFEKARDILRTFPREKIALTEIVVSVVERSWERALAEVDAARGLKALRPKQRFWLDVLEARARFELAFRDVPRPEGEEFIIPSTGLPHVDYEGLRPAYRASLQAMQAAQRLNWPADIQYILDVFPVSAMLLGHSKEALPLLIALGLARPLVPAIREVVGKMAVQLDHPEIALELYARAGTAPRYYDELAVVAVAAVKVGKIPQAMELITDEFLANTAANEGQMSSLVVLGMAAQSTLRQDVVDRILARLDRDAVSRQWKAILWSGLQVQQSILQRPAAIKELHTYWADSGRPPAVAYHLLTNLDSKARDEAAIFVEVANDLLGAHSLSAELLADLGQALLTLGRPVEALRALEGGRTRFKDDPKILSLLGVALELNGLSPQAFELLERLLNEGKASETARRLFIEISVRMGFFRKAEEHVRNAFANSQSRTQKLRLLQTLFQLLQREGRAPEQVEEVAWEYGKLAKQDDEREEGIFLQEYLLGTLSEAVTPKPERIEEFRRRMEAYSTAFPKSKYIFRAEVPTTGPPEEMLKALRDAVGHTNERLERETLVERRLDQGALLVPFSWRPRRFLSNIPDVFMLWEIRKTAPFQRASLHFQSTVAGFNRNTPPTVGGCEAVMSLTSLLLLDELGLLGFALDTFPKIVIARATLLALQEGRGIAGWGYERATRILEQLQRVFAKIVHPPYLPVDEDSHLPPWHAEEKLAMSVPGRVYFCDDIVETYLVCLGEPAEAVKPSVSVVDFLTWADRVAGLVTPERVAAVIGHLTRLRVMAIIVARRYFIAAIPGALNEAGSRAEAERIVAESQTFRSILDGVWDHHKPFPALIEHFSAVMSYLFRETTAGPEVLIALWLRWLQAVRFQSKPAAPAIDKMALGFIAILKELNAEEIQIQRLWSSLWAALGRGLGGSLNEPEDQAGIRAVAAVLGQCRALDKTQAAAASLYDKAKLGLVDGTAGAALLSDTYVNTMAKRVLEEKVQHDKP